MISIKEINIPTRGIATKVELVSGPILIGTSNGFQVKATLLDDDNNILIQSSVDISNSMYDQWGTEDSFIVDYVLEELGLTKL